MNNKQKINCIPNMSKEKLNEYLHKIYKITENSRNNNNFVTNKTARIHLRTN